MFTVDGVQWSIPCDITRTAEVKVSDISGMMLDRTYFYDVLGTYMQYDVNLIPNPHDLDSYYTLFETLSEPVDAHTFVFPYNGSTVTVTGRISNISDIYRRMPNGGRMWIGVSFTVTSIEPTKEVTLDGVITRGRTPLPDVAEPSQGDSYTWNGSEWVVSTTYENADNISY